MNFNVIRKIMFATFIVFASLGASYSALSMDSRENELEAKVPKSDDAQKPKDLSEYRDHLKVWKDYKDRVWDYYFRCWQSDLKSAEDKLDRNQSDENKKILEKEMNAILYNIKEYTKKAQDVIDIEEGRLISHGYFIYPYKK